MEKDYIDISGKQYEIVLTFINPNNQNFEYILYKKQNEIYGGKYNINDSSKTLITDLSDEEKILIEKVYTEGGSMND